MYYSVFKTSGLACLHVIIANNGKLKNKLTVAMYVNMIHKISYPCQFSLGEVILGLAPSMLARTVKVSHTQAVAAELEKHIETI